MGKRSEVIFGNRMSSQVVKRAENSRERFVRRFGDDSEILILEILSASPTLL